ncbi:MAG: hypothetical protein ABW023_00655 [Sphingomonas sp.]
MPPPKPFIVDVGSSVIGAVTFTGWDPGMAVAFGIFRPNEDYIGREHATVLDGVELLHTDKLHLTWPDGRSLICDAVGLVDNAADGGIDSREIVAFGVRDGEFSNVG